VGTGPLSLLSNALIAEAKRYIGVTEQPANSNRGLCIDYWVREAGLDPAGGFPWCAAFVGQIGRQAVGYRWPAPRTAGVMTLVAWAAAKGLISKTGAGGDLFVLWSESLQRFAHVGLVTNFNVTTNEYDTVEGNTNNDGSREGFGVFARHRTLHPRDRFIRWEAAL
jgi:hypothetical protein